MLSVRNFSNVRYQINPLCRYIIFIVSHEIIRPLRQTMFLIRPNKVSHQRWENAIM